MRDKEPGIGLAFGAAIGVVVFAFTGSVVWVAGGAALGLIMGAATSSRPDQSESTKQKG